MLSRVERGKYNQNISLNMLLDIAEGLGIPVSVFVSFTPEEQALWNGYGLRETVVTEDRGFSPEKPRPREGLL